MRYTTKIVPPFDFSAAQELSIDELFDEVLERIRVAIRDIQKYFPEPMLPEPGGTDAEIDQLASSLGVELPPGYRSFLRRAKYAVIDDGVQLWGLEHNGVSYGEGLWVSDKHRAGESYLVFGYYWAYADGDQLLIPLGSDEQPVVLYLHEHGPLFEFFAPSFPLALWRLTHEHGAA
jgi:hypothetical protein